MCGVGLRYDLHIYHGAINPVKRYDFLDESAYLSMTRVMTSL